MSFSNPRRERMTPSATLAEKKIPPKTTVTLPKSATFHSPSSPRAINVYKDYVPPRLSRCQSQPDDITETNRRRMALTSALDDIDKAFSKTSLSDKKSKKKWTLRDTSAPVPRGFFSLPVTDSAMAEAEQKRRILQPRSVRRNHHHTSDSGLGSSLASTVDKCCAADAAAKKNSKALAAIHTSDTSHNSLLSGLSQPAVALIKEKIIKPLRDVEPHKTFKPILDQIDERLETKDIICLRDVEKALVIETRGLPKALAFYQQFGHAAIATVEQTYQLLSEDEQVRPQERPYNEGYFIDLREQVSEYARMLAAEDGGLTDGAAIDKTLGLRLHGGIAENGRPAELVAFRKDGTAISMASKKPVDLHEAPIKFKRSLSEQLDDDEEIARSMARRRKNATPEELAPKRCTEPGCNKQFLRPCDLKKHMNQHTRLNKCPHESCKYSKRGLPTEQELARHINDKHTKDPFMFKCRYPPCTYQTKRKTNCDQHMEKAHGFTYNRTRGKRVKAEHKKRTPKSAEMDTPVLANISPPNTTPSYSVPTPPQDGVYHHGMLSEFPTCHQDLSSVGIYPQSLELSDFQPGGTPVSSGSPYEHNGHAFYQDESNPDFNSDDDLYAAHPMLMTTSNPMPIALTKMMLQNMPMGSMVPSSMTPLTKMDSPFTPTSQGNIMLYTGTEGESFIDPLTGYNGFEGHGVERDFQFPWSGYDFQLFPLGTSTAKVPDKVPLFADMPSANTGLSQISLFEMEKYMDTSQVDCGTDGES